MSQALPDQSQKSGMVTHIRCATHQLFLDHSIPIGSCAREGVPNIHIALTNRLRPHTHNSSLTPLIQRSPFA